MKKKIIVGIVIVLVIIVAVVANNKPEENPNGKPVVKIGVIYPLTGAMSNLGRAHKTGLLLALEEMQKSNLKYNYELILEDNQLDSRKTAMIANKMVNFNNVDVIFTMGSDVGNIVNSVLVDKEILQLGWITDPKVAERDLSFPYAAMPVFEADLMAKTLASKGFDNINIFSANNNYHMSHRLAIEEIFPKYDINYTFFTFNSGERDFRMMIEKSKLTDAKINMLSAYSPELDILAKQLKESNSDLPVTSMGDFSFAENKDLFEGAWFVMPNKVTDKDFLTKAKSKLESESTESLELTYEVFKEFLKICEKTPFENGSLDVRSFAQSLIGQRHIDSKLLGRFTIMENGFISVPAAAGIIKNGKVEVLEE